MCVCVQARANGQGSMCNQAIMLITDGAMEDFESVFEEFNWPERRVRTELRLDGREVPDPPQYDVKCLMAAEQRHHQCLDWFPVNLTSTVLFCLDHHFCFTSQS